MKKSFIFSLVLILTFSTLLSADNKSILDAGSLNTKIDYVPGELLVKYKTQVRNTSSSFYKTNWNISTIRTFKSIGYQHVKLPQTMTVEQAMDMYRNDPNVEYAEPNYIYHATRNASDPSFNELWGLDNTGQTVNGTDGTDDADIDATEAWDIVTGSSEVVIAVIDSGVKWNHEDLIGNIWSNPGETAGNGMDDDGNTYIDDIRGWDFVDNDNDPMDYNGHGTHVAGTIAAVGNNGTGVTGVCWTAIIMPLRGLDAAGSGTTDNLISAILYANDNGADIINNSWGGTTPTPSQALKNAIDASSAVVVCAAGNSNENTDTTPHYPSSFTSTNLISVAATNQNDDLASFSNYGATSVDVGAPGTNIYSTIIERTDDNTIDDFNRALLGNTWTTSGTNITWGIENGETLADSPGVNYANDTDSYAQLDSPVNLTGLIGPRLEFQVSGETEYGFDYIAVQLSSDRSKWVDHFYVHGPLNQLVTIEIDINSYTSGSGLMYIRFYFHSDSSYVYEGFQIDDLKITVLTDIDNAYEYFNGTSMAAPIVSGIAGLVKAHYPGATNIEIKTAIEASVDTIPAMSGIVATDGRVNAHKIFLPVTAPSGLAVTGISHNRIDLSWNENNSNEMGFIIERKTGAAGTYAQIHITAANESSYGDGGVSSSTEYFYQVYAYNLNGNSTYTNEANATTQAAPPDNGGGGGCFISTAASGF